jgi:LacI family transcriptional regulator
VQGSQTRNVTIREVAREAGVGVGTVSRVLSGSSKVGDATRANVMKVIERLGYRPSRIARSLAKGTTGAIGVVIPFFTQHYFLEILRGIQTKASESDYSLVVHNMESPEQLKSLLAADVLRERVDGLIVVAIDPADIEGVPSLASLPMVCVDTELRGATAILPDHAAGTYLSTKHLIGHGHKRLALIDRPQYPVSNTTIALRRLGFLRACREAGLGDDDQVLETAAYSPEGGYSSANAMLETPEPPTGFICASDVQAIGVMRAVAEAGRSLGTEAAVIGYHDVDLAQYACATSVHLPAFEMGSQALESLTKAIAGSSEGAPERIVFHPSLTVRASCGCAGESRLFGWPGFYTGPKDA